MPRCLAKMIRYLPTPPQFFFSSDFGNSHDPTGFGLGGGTWPPPSCPLPAATLLLPRRDVRSAEA